MSNEYITRTHSAIDEFDIEGQEAQGELPPAEPQSVEPESREPEVEQVTTETVEPVTEQPPAQQEPAPEVTQEQGQGAQDAIDQGDVNPDDLSDIVGPEGKYMTYREAAKATRSLQSMYDKKFEEQNRQFQQQAQAQAQQLEQWNQWYAHQQQEAQKQAQVDGMSTEQWAYQIDNFPGDTLNWAAAEYPDAVPHIISRIRQTKGDAIADQMMVGYQQQMVQQQAYQQQVAMQQQQAQVQADPSRNIQAAMQAVNERYGDEFDSMQEDVSAMIQSGNYQIDFSDPANIAGAVEHAFLAAHRDRTLRQNQQAASQPQVASPQAETGAPGQAPASSEEDAIADEIVNYYNDNPYIR